MAGVKKKKKAPARSASMAARTGELERCRKKLEVMSIELKIYRDLGGLASDGASTRIIMGRLMDFVLKALDTDSGTLYLLSPDREDLTFEVVKGPLAGKLNGLNIRSDKGIVGLVARTGRPYISEDLARDKVWAGIKDSGRNKNMMAVPLKIKGSVIGVIEAINKADAEPFSKADLRVLSSIANHFSIIMERGRLFTELDERLRQLSMLNEVGALLSSSLDQSVIRQRAMEAITRLMRAETGSLLLVDEGAGVLTFEVALGEKGETLKKEQIPMGRGIAGWVARTGKPLIVNDPASEKRFMSSMDRRNEFKTRNLICVPMSIKGSVIGVLEAINKTDGPFTKDDLSLFELLSSQVAIALDNARLYTEIREAFYETSGALAEAIETRDPYTGGHTKRVLEYCLAAARHLKMSDEEHEILKLSAVLHDVGKIGVEDGILRKRAPLDDDEAAAMRKHPLYGAQILRHVPQLKAVVPGTLHHHERPDGKGYPDGLKGRQIPMPARIIAVADTYDAMTTDRPYRKGLAPEKAIEEIRRHSGTQFDRKVVAAFIKAFRRGEIEGISHSQDPLNKGRAEETT